MKRPRYLLLPVENKTLLQKIFTNYKRLIKVDPERKLISDQHKADFAELDNLLFGKAR